MAEKPDDEKPNDKKPNDEKPNGEKPNNEKPNGEKPNGEKPPNDGKRLDFARIHALVFFTLGITFCVLFLFCFFLEQSLFIKLKRQV